MARRNRTRNSRTGRRSHTLGVSNATPQPMLSLTPAEVFERTLGRTNDSCVLRGKLIITPNLTNTPSQVSYLVPNFFGARATQFAGVFSRFRIKAINLRFLPSAGGTGGAGPAVATVFGILDDPSSQVVPTTGSDVLELRSSALALPAQTVPSNILYTPVDKTKWYYIGGTGTSPDPRLTVPGFLYGYANSATAVSSAVEIDFSLVFAGASDNGVS